MQALREVAAFLALAPAESRPAHEFADAARGLAEACTDLEHALEDLEVERASLLGERAHLHQTIGCLLSVLAKERSGAGKSMELPSPEAMFARAKSYLEQVRLSSLTGALTSTIGAERAVSPDDFRPESEDLAEWSPRSLGRHVSEKVFGKHVTERGQELGKHVSEQLGTFKSKLSSMSSSASQHQLGRRVIEHRQKLEEHLKDQWSEFTNRASSGTGRQVIEQSLEFGKHVTEQFQPALVQQSTQQLQQQFLEGCHKLGLLVSQDFSVVLNSLPWRKDNPSDEDSGPSLQGDAASSVDPRGSSAAVLAAEAPERPAEATASVQNLAAEGSRLGNFVGSLRARLALDVWKMPASFPFAAATAGTREKKRRRKPEQKSEEDAFTRVLVELEVRLEDGRVARGTLRTSDTRAKVVNRLVRKNSLDASIKDPLKALLKAAVAGAERFPVELRTDVGQLLAGAAA